MSRLMVKNLPKNITENKLREIFSEKGIVTDVQLKYTKDGVFRQFGFIGFQTEEQGATALQYFNKTCINTNRIVVEPCVALGSDKKPKSWSKYAHDSTAFKKIHGTIEKKEDEVEKIKKDEKQKNKIDELLAEHKNDPKFIEFMDAHGKGKGIWENDLGLEKEDVTQEDFDEHDDDEIGGNSTGKYVKLKPSVDEQSDDEEAKSEDEDNSDGKIADKDISDKDYMKSLIQKSSNSSKANVKKEIKLIDLLTIKIRNIPFKTKRQDVITFFKPLKPYSIRLPTKVHGICYVGFKTEADFKKAMLKNRSFWKGKQIAFADFTEKNKQSKEKIDENVTKNPKWAKQEENIKNEEHISESGRIFFRNLPYSVNEDELREVFDKYGPIAEINLPIDPLTRIIKGFGTVTYVMPEHAVQCFNELDGTIFHGRLLHLIPGKIKDEEDLNEEGLNFKQKKALKLKKTAGSSHNWNTLFLGANAVANILANTYATSKEHILDSNSSGTSAAVRLALGETEIVLQMKKFLEKNDVCLDVFEGSTTKRSKTVIIAKNLPANTRVKDIQPLFSKFGLLGRVVLPPSGVTALIEFLEPTEARAAFRKLAYSKFKDLPLYLEWAPDNTFKAPATKPLEQDNIVDADVESKSEPIIEQKEEVVEDSHRNIEETVEDDTPPEPNTTIFLRNLNFVTKEPTVREHFKSLGQIHMIQVATKKDFDNPNNRISLGYGFIQFKRNVVTEKVLQTMQFTMIEGNKVELKRSDRILQSQVNTTKKSAKAMKQTGTKILVRNIPFQAKQSEVQEIFQAFGEIRTVRLPKKMTLGEESHRGFGFVDFYSESDAKKSFDSLCQSTHLYGRRLVLEWAAPDESVEELRKRTAEHFHSSQSKKSKTVFDTTIMENMDEDKEIE